MKHSRSMLASFMTARRSRAPHRRPGFTLVELMVVVAVIAVLVTLVTVVGVKVAYAHKVQVTRNTMRLTRLAIDQFKEADPLRNIYNRPEGIEPSGYVVPTFGPFPPYPLAFQETGNSAPGTVSFALEPNHPLLLAGFGDSLQLRLARDLSGSTGTINKSDWASASLDPLDNPGSPRPDDPRSSTGAIRALYAYLKLYAPDALEQIPEAARKPVDPNAYNAEYMNPSGSGVLAGNPRRVDVLGINDAWGAPLDYFLCVKLEYKARIGAATPGWQVVDRVPMLWSHGVQREQYFDEYAGKDKPDSNKWLFSEDFPSPAARCANKRTAALSGTAPATAGWARALGWNKQPPPAEADDNMILGFVP